MSDPNIIYHISLLVNFYLTKIQVQTKKIFDGAYLPLFLKILYLFRSSLPVDASVYFMN